jgi:hypothetical protein
MRRGTWRTLTQYLVSEHYSVERDPRACLDLLTTGVSQRVGCLPSTPYSATNDHAMADMDQPLLTNLDFMSTRPNNLT